MGAVVHANSHKNFWTRIPLAFRILGGVILGIIVGISVGKTNPGLLKLLGDCSKVFIDLLRGLATPLIFFAVLDAILRTSIPPRKGFKLLGFSAVNACVAILIGLTLANTIRGGDNWRGKLDIVTQEVKDSSRVALQKVDEKAQLNFDPGALLRKFVPSNLIEPFQKDNIITVVLMAILAGAALRLLKRHSEAARDGVQTLEGVFLALFNMFAIILGWIIEIIPLAIFGVVAMVVGETGLGLFRNLGVFLVIILLGLFLHAVVYYSILLFAVARTSPLKFFSDASEAIVTALSCGSSLATLPVTLRCLKEKMHISDANARLAACVGTNLNHTGIILYEMAATIFVAQAVGVELTISQQIVVALASIAAGVGIAGVPEAGLITLQLVLTAGGIKPDVVAAVLPLLFTVDWIIGRGRAATNVISDMTVATLLERLDPDEPVQAPPAFTDHLIEARPAAVASDFNA